MHLWPISVSRERPPESIQGRGALNDLTTLFSVCTAGLWEVYQRASLELPAALWGGPSRQCVHCRLQRPVPSPGKLTSQAQVHILGLGVCPLPAEPWPASLSGSSPDNSRISHNSVTSRLGPWLYPPCQGIEGSIKLKGLSSFRQQKLTLIIRMKSGQGVIFSGTQGTHGTFPRITVSGCMAATACEEAQPGVSPAVQGSGAAA